MAYFVRDDFGDLLLDPNAAILVYKEHDLPKRDGSPVLHRSSGKLRDRDEMQLGKVVLRTKIGLEEFDRISGDAQRILRARTLAWYGSYYVVDSVEPVFHFFKLADSQVQEVRGHSRISSSTEFSLTSVSDWSLILTFPSKRRFRKSTSRNRS